MEKRKEEMRKRTKLPKLPIPDKRRIRMKSKIACSIAISEEKNSCPRKTYKEGVPLSLLKFL